MNKKATVDAADFYAALTQVSKVLCRMPTSLPPALSQIKVQFSNQRCILTATDLNTWLIKNISAQGDDFSFVFKHTRDIVKSVRLFRGDLAMEFSDTGEGKNRKLELCMSCGNRAGEFEVLPPEEHPVYSPLKAEDTFTMNAASLLSRIDHVCYVVPKPDSGVRPSAAGVQCLGPHVYALDGKRMACDTDASFAFPRPFMANASALQHLALFGDREVQVTVGNYQVQFTDGSDFMAVSKTGGDFFRVENAIPREFREEFSVVPQDFLKELRYLKESAARERHPYVRLSGNKLVMPVSTGKYSTSIEISGEHTVTFGFDLHNMMDAINQFKDEPAVRMKVLSEVSPIIVEAENRTDFALICPVRLTKRLAAA